MSLTSSIVEIADELIAFAVTGTAIVCAAYTVYTTGEIPEYLPMGFGLVLAYYFNKRIVSTT